jgi:DNA-binding CsgD family transcriptional regulator
MCCTKAGNMPRGIDINGDKREITEFGNERDIWKTVQVGAFTGSPFRSFPFQNTGASIGSHPMQIVNRLIGPRWHANQQRDTWANLKVTGMEPEEVIDAIGRAARGEMVVASSMMLKIAQILQSGLKGSAINSLVASLTDRERQVLDHVASGQSNKVIAKALDISHNTVKLHVRHIMDKLNLRSRVEAANFSFEYRSSPDGAKAAGESIRKSVR